MVKEGGKEEALKPGTRKRRRQRTPLKIGGLRKQNKLLRMTLKELQSGLREQTGILFAVALLLEKRTECLTMIPTGETILESMTK